MHVPRSILLLLVTAQTVKFKVNLPHALYLSWKCNCPAHLSSMYQTWHVQIWGIHREGGIETEREEGENIPWHTSLGLILRVEWDVPDIGTLPVRSEISCCRVSYPHLLIFAHWCHPGAPPPRSEVITEPSRLKGRSQGHGAWKRAEDGGEERRVGLRTPPASPFADIWSLCNVPVWVLMLSLALLSVTAEINKTHLSISELHHRTPPTHTTWFNLKNQNLLPQCD